MNRFLYLIVAVTVVAAIYLCCLVAYPYWTLHRLETALLSRDAAALETLVDWQQLRTGLKADFRRYMAETMNQSVGCMEGAGTPIGTALGGTIIDSLIDGNASANGLLTLWQQKLDADSAKKRPGDFVTSARFQSLTTFRVEMRNPDDQQSATLTLLLELAGAEWRVTKVVLPPNAFQVAMMTQPSPTK
jgi:DUF2939 family protein